MLTVKRIHRRKNAAIMDVPVSEEEASNEQRHEFIYDDSYNSSELYEFEE